MKKLIFIFLGILILPNIGKAQNNNLLFSWDFNDTTVISQKSKPGSELLIGGLTKFVPGVKDTAIKFDGFSSFIDAIPSALSHEDYEFPKSISFEAWISLGAYPWNWAPILTIGKYKITGFYLGIDSRGRVGLHMSDATSVWHECNSKLNPTTKLGLELKKWYHVVGTYNPKDGLAIYVNGKLENTYNNFTFDYGIAYNETEKGFRMGMNREMLAPTDAIRDWATYPSRYSLDGIIDEVKIYNKCLTADEIQANYTLVKPENEPQFAARKFPTVKPSGRFGANYMRLKYYPEWDAIWPVGEFDDVVVQFDELPTKIMFWRGTRYSPCLVTENGKWMADQSRETGNNWFLSQGSRNDMPTGCIEHMSDVQCRSSRVSIIESNDARVVVNWRYLQMDVKYRQMDLPNNTGFGQWGSEIYYIYPDGVVVRKLLPGEGGWQESIFLSEPGTRPEDNMELAAATLMNMKGESKTYSWEKGYPVYDLPDANIQVINLKSQFKPFTIFRTGGSWEVFNLEVRPEYSHFPWWNHWPVAQIISDGRSANAPDRAAHSSLSWGNPVGDVALYGMTDKDPQTIVSLARSWNYPAELKLSGSGFESAGYDYSQRAYILRMKSNPANLKFTLAGNEGSPLVNPAFVIKNWKSSNVRLILDGKSINRGKDFRYAVEYDVDGTPSLIVWIKYQSEKKAEFELISIPE
ncbi:MAG: LamG domain-containing protein [Bacteroidetes bacterium]|nr:LamG domain-containing protein [Bacteroidota bacterium]MDA1085105.1 LamG domain-containing protein [Bacteroidota bacterium]